MLYTYNLRLSMKKISLFPLSSSYQQFLTSRFGLFLYLQGIEKRARSRVDLFSLLSDILSISRGIFKWLCQQQVVNPFFKGSTATVRFEVARVKRTPSGDLFVFFALSFTGVLFVLARPSRRAYRFLRKPPSRHEPANLCTFSNHAVSFPVPLPCERIPQRLHGLRGEKGFPVIGNSLFGSTRLSLNWYDGFCNKFIRFSSGVLAI